jgi:Flp pilus assembly protein TadG
MATLTRVRRLRDDRGAELIEMALILPVLMLIIAGIVDFGFLFQKFNVVTNAAREGARMGILPDGYGDADVRSRVRTYLQDAGVDSAGSVVDIDPVTIATSGADVQAKSVRVTIFHHFSVLDPISRLIGGSFSSISVSGRAVMRLE